MPDQRVADGVLSRMVATGTEELIFASDPDSGLQAIVVIDDTTLGPALGGVRMHPYSSEHEAMTAGLRLSHAMTMKAAAAGLDLGGATALVLASPDKEKSEALLTATGRVLSGLSDRFIAVNDVGTTSEDMLVLQRAGARICTRDPSSFTAEGVVESMKAIWKSIEASTSLKGVRVAVQGIGNVGERLVGLLATEGAVVTAADVDRRRAETVATKYGVMAVDAEELLDLECDILSPCAMGSVVTFESIRRLRCRAIVGAANNIVESPGVEDLLAKSGIVYAPDFVTNAGGLIGLENELLGNDDDEARRRVHEISGRVRAVLEETEHGGGTTIDAARRIALDRLRMHRVRRHT